LTKQRTVGAWAAVLVAPILIWPAPAAAQPPGRSDPSFSQPSRAPGVDYVLPTEAEIKATLDRIRDYFVRSTPYRIIDTATGAPITDLTKPNRTAGIDLRQGQFNDWDYPMGVVLAAMLQTADITGDATYSDYALKNFDFIFDHLDYFREQARQFGPQAYGYRRLIEMRELDDCGAIGAALIKAYNKKKDARYRATIDAVAEHIAHKQFRMPDGTLARQRPQPVSLWADDLYMSVPFLAHMGALTGQRAWFDDGARQVIQASARLQDKTTGLWDHSWFENTDPDPKFYWGRGSGWAIMAAAELLSVLPEDHPERARAGDFPARRAGSGGRARRHRSLASIAGQDRQLPGDLGFGDVHLRHRARREPRLALAGLRSGGAGGLAGAGHAGAGGWPHRRHLGQHHRRLRRRLLLQPPHRSRGDAGLRPHADGRRRSDRHAAQLRRRAHAEHVPLPEEALAVAEGDGRAVGVADLGNSAG
jgi:rhamnogalacturonyl hydrolase YesR